MKPRISGIADEARGVEATGRALRATMSRSKPGFLGGGQIEIVHAELASFGEQGIVDVGDVADALDGVAFVDQMALEQVVGDERRGVTEVRGVVRGDPARVHQHVLVRFEWHDLGPRSVEQLQGRHAPDQPHEGRD